MLFCKLQNSLKIYISWFQEVNGESDWGKANTPVGSWAGGLEKTHGPGWRGGSWAWRCKYSDREWAQGGQDTWGCPCCESHIVPMMNALQHWSNVISWLPPKLAPREMLNKTRSSTIYTNEELRRIVAFATLKNPIWIEVQSISHFRLVLLLRCKADANVVY